MTGIPAEAFDFYDHLSADNTRDFWAAHKGDYERYVREPLQELVDVVAPEFGPAHLYRPYRDIRFSADKTPYKDHQGCVFEGPNGLGWYLQISSAGLMAGGGWYQSTPAQVKRYRDYLLDQGSVELRATLKPLSKAGFDIDGQQLKTKPRGVPDDNPDLDLLRHRTLYVMKYWEPAAWMGTKRVERTVRDAFEKMRPMMEVLGGIVGPAE